MLIFTLLQKALKKILWPTDWFKGVSWKALYQSTILGRDWKKWNRYSYQERLNISTNKSIQFPLALAWPSTLGKVQSLGLNQDVVDFDLEKQKSSGSGHKKYDNLVCKG